MDCKGSPVTPPKIVAIATDKYLTPTHAFPDPSNLPGSPVPKYGQDFTFGTGRTAPKGHNVGSTEAELKAKMQRLLGIFARNDKTGMAQRLFDQFLAKQTKVVYFDDRDLSKAAAGHTNLNSFIDLALGAPGARAPKTGVTRIHQALKAANWDIAKLVAPTDLGILAFNNGDKKWDQTGDFANGLGVMINGVQHAYLIATHYRYDAAEKKYCITLRCNLYDVFGLDDDDLDEYGEKSDGVGSAVKRGIVGGGASAVMPGMGPVVAVKLETIHVAGVGITAWWQLQHQFGYAPLVTRIIVTKSYEVPAV